MYLYADTVDQAVDLVNKLRKNHKGTWVFVEVTLGGHVVKLKMFNTWVQRAQVMDGRYESSLMDTSVKDFKEFLNGLFTRIADGTSFLTGGNIA